MMMVKQLLVITALFFVSACAFGDARLNIAHNAKNVTKGVISEAPATRVIVHAFTDSRDETNAIGYKRNGFGAKTADILSERPSTELVRAALIDTLQKNGHILSGDDGAATVQGDLKKFWFDYKTGFTTVEFIGAVQTDITVTRNDSGEQLFKETFSGNSNRKVLGGLEQTWTEVMNDALDDLTRNIGNSIALKDALQAGGDAS